MGRTDRQSDPDKHPGREKSNAASLWLRIRENASDGDAAGRGVDLIVEKVHGTLLREPVLTSDPHRDGKRDSVLTPLKLAIVDRLANPQERGLVHVEISIDRIERDHRCEQCLVLVDQIAHREVIPADLAVDRGCNLGEFNVELKQFQVLHRRLDSCFRLLDRREILIELLLTDRVCDPLVDPEVPAVHHSSQLELRSIQVNLTLERRDLCLVGPGIDLEEDVALLHNGPLLERHAPQIPRDPRTDVDGLDRVDPSREIDEVGDFPLHGLTHGNHQ